MSTHTDAQTDWTPSASDVTHRTRPTAWAQDLMSRRTDGSWVILDTETTGLDESAELVQIGVLSASGHVLLDALIRPAGPIPPDATAIHGLTNDHMRHALPYSSIHLALAEILALRDVVTYNAAFDDRLLTQTQLLHNLSSPLLARSWQCAMDQYATWIGAWNRRTKTYRYRKLPGAGHSAIADCRATLALIETMAYAHEKTHTPAQTISDRTRAPELDLERALEAEAQ